MPKAILEFNLPEEDWEFKYTAAAMDHHVCVHDLDQTLRSWLRDETCPFKTKEEVIEYVRKELSPLLLE